MKLLKMFGVMAVAGLLLASCASVAYVEKDDSVNFSNYKTFAWVNGNEDAKKGSNLVETNIRGAVNKELEKEGWREVKNRPDVLLSYDVLVEKGIKENTNPVYSQPFTRVFFNPYTRRYGTIYYPSQFMGYDRDQFEIREGTVTITMIDAKTDKTVWQGWTTDEVNSKNLTSKEIQSSVKSIFRKFDVAKN
ncbi:MAG TPA: DUF4136 domain-containing protein [Chitinophagaceae bacterium]|nr:DUF4136 domain-containing protein [Chitinophagaceae bacterium]